MGDESTGGRLTKSNRLLLAVVLLTGVVLPGLLRHWLGQLGLDALGTAVFVAGYGTMVLLVWWGWIRPLDITGPGGATEGSSEDRESGGDGDGTEL